MLVTYSVYFNIQQFIFKSFYIFMMLRFSANKIIMNESFGTNDFLMVFISWQKNTRTFFRYFRRLFINCKLSTDATWLKNSHFFFTLTRFSYKNKLNNTFKSTHGIYISHCYLNDWKAILFILSYMDILVVAVLI